MVHRRYRVFAAVATMLLPWVAAAAQPWVLSRSGDEITLRWYADTTAQAEALDLANTYCARAGRGASLHAIERDGSAVIADYRCF